jgi:hypothetical protein
MDLANEGSQVETERVFEPDVQIYLNYPQCLNKYWVVEIVTCLNQFRKTWYVEVVPNQKIYIFSFYGGLNLFFSIL